MAQKIVGLFSRVISKVKISKVAIIALVITVFTFGVVVALAMVEVTCDRCGGEGTITVPAFRAPSQTKTCPKCGGEGRILALQTAAGHIGVEILGVGILTAVISALKPSWIREFKTKPLGIGLFVMLNIITSIFYFFMYTDMPHPYTFMYPYEPRLIYILIPEELWSKAFLLFMGFLYFCGADFSLASIPLYFSDRLIGTLLRPIMFYSLSEALKPLLYFFRMSYPMLVAYGLWNHKKWGWFLSIIPPFTITILNLYTFAGIPYVIYGPPLFVFHALSILLNVLLIFYLTRPRIRNIFGMP